MAVVALTSEKKSIDVVFLGATAFVKPVVQV